MSCGEWPVIAERRCFLLSTMAADAGGEVGGGGLFFAQWQGPFLHVLALPLRQHAASPTRRRAGSPIPKARRQGGGRGGRVRQEAPRQPRPCGAARPTLRGADELPGRSEPLRGPQGQPLHRPALARHRLPLCPREWQGRVEQDRFGPVRGVDAPPRKGRSAAWGVGPPHGGPELGADDTGRLGRPPLPGLAAVGWSRRKRLALSGAGPRSAQGAVARAAALATVPRQGGTPRRTGGRSAPDRPRAPSRLTLRQRKAPSRDADCLRGQPRLRLVSQAPRQRRFSGIVGCGTPQEARPGAPL